MLYPSCFSVEAVDRQDEQGWCAFDWAARSGQTACADAIGACGDAQRAQQLLQRCAALSQSMMLPRMMALMERAQLASSLEQEGGVLVPVGARMEEGESGVGIGRATPVPSRLSLQRHRREREPVVSAVSSSARAQPPETGIASKGPRKATRL